MSHREAGWAVNVQMIEQERVVRGWTQRQLARYAGIDEGTLTDLLAERRRPTFRTILAICASLEVTLAQVIVFKTRPSQLEAEG